MGPNTQQLTNSLTNSLEEECHLELFSNPAFDEMEDSFEVLSNLLRNIFMETQTEISNMVTLFAEKQESCETVTAKGQEKK